MLGWLCYGGCLLVPRGAALVASMEGAGLLPPTRASWPGTSRPSHSSFCPPAKVFRAFPHRSASDDLIHDVISHCESCHLSTTYRLPCSHRYCRRACSCADAPEVSVLNFFVSVEDVSVSFCDTGTVSRLCTCSTTTPSSSMASPSETTISPPEKWQ
jgi:hypothetical protein